MIGGETIKEIIGELNILQRRKQAADNELLSETDDGKKEKLRMFSSEVEAFINYLKGEAELKNDNQQRAKNDEKSPLPSILKYATFQNIKDREKVYFLSVDIKAGGTSRSTRGIFSSRLRHSGGVILNYMIYDYDQAKIVYSNLHNEYTGFKKIRSSK